MRSRRLLRTALAAGVVLGLSSAACRATVPASTPPASPATATSSPEALPHKLTSEQIRAALKPTVPPAQQCAQQHGGDGTQLQVKLRIAGVSGRVDEATAVTPNVEPDLADCVIAAARAAEFPRFSTEELTVIFPYRF